ncbi:MAG TPA: hypothetical protein VI756_29745 [Blastocatellia bacterium]
MIILLDSGPLGRLANPRATGESAQCLTWLETMITAEVRVMVPEICDYEIRRELLRINSAKSVAILDELRIRLGLVALNRSTMLRAADLWAQTRKIGLPTAHDKALDVDVILAAQALEVNGIIATENAAHLNRFVKAEHWRDISGI